MSSCVSGAIGLGWRAEAGRGRAEVGQGKGKATYSSSGL